MIFQYTNPCRLPCSGMIERPTKCFHFYVVWSFARPCGHPFRREPLRRAHSRYRPKHVDFFGNFQNLVKKCLQAFWHSSLLPGRAICQSPSQTSLPPSILQVFFSSSFSSPFIPSSISSRWAKRVIRAVRLSWVRILVRVPPNFKGQRGLNPAHWGVEKRTKLLICSPDKTSTDFQGHLRYIKAFGLRFKIRKGFFR